MSFPGSLAADRWFPIRLVDDDDLLSPKVGVAYGAIAVAFSVEGAASAAYVPGAGDWIEHGAGNYWLRIGEEEFVAAGRYIVAVTLDDTAPYNFVVDVQASLRIVGPYQLTNDGAAKVHVDLGLAGLDLEVISVTKHNADQSAWAPADEDTTVTLEVGDGLYRLEIGAADLDVLGASAFKCDDGDGHVGVVLVQIVSPAWQPDGGSKSAPNE